jgi:hypothetical protein
MHSQPAVVFKKKRSMVVTVGILAIFFLDFGIICLFQDSRGFLVAGIMLIGLGLYGCYVLWTAVAKPYLHLTDTQVTLYRGVFPSPIRYPLADIEGSHTNHPETYIELLGKDSTDTIRINLNPLDKADRIRFIFLVESSINRKFSHKHTLARESAG